MSKNRLPQGRGVAMFDNEPRNVLAMHRVIPSATSFFLNTVYAGYAMEVLVDTPEILWIPDFKWP